MTLTRESTPTQGMNPAVEPQHFKKGSTTATDLTGEDHPLPVKITQFTSFKVINLSVNTTAVEITAGLTNRKSLRIHVNGTDIVYLGDNTVTTNDGYPLLPGHQYEFQFNPVDAISLYAIATSAQNLRLFETN